MADGMFQRFGEVDLSRSSGYYVRWLGTYCRASGSRWDQTGAFCLSSEGSGFSESAVTLVGTI